MTRRLHFHFIAAITLPDLLPLWIYTSCAWQYVGYVANAVTTGLYSFPTLATQIHLVFHNSQRWIIWALCVVIHNLWRPCTNANRFLCL